MNIKALDPVVLIRDLPEHGLCKGDLGAVVQVYGQDGLEVEFVRASGGSGTVVTLEVTDVRAATSSDQIAVRPSPHESC